MKRRTFLAVLTGWRFATPRAATAQQTGKVYRIAYLVTSLPSTPADQGPFTHRMREMGWVHGRDFVIARAAFGDRVDRAADLAAEMMRAGVDVFVVTGAADAAAVQRVTRTIPIVAWGAGDFVAAGLAASLARPGGNVTGIQTLQPELASKHLSILKEAIPHLARAGILFRQSQPSQPPGGSLAAALREAETGGKTLGIALQMVRVHDAGDLAGAFNAFRAERAQAVIIVRDQFMGVHIETLVSLALKHRLPTISDMFPLATQGGLVSYGFSIPDALRSAADIVDKILRGAKPGEIPIQQVTTFRLVINARTAKTLGLVIPPGLLARADEIVQ